jgi:large subunit ribosomal protein L6
MSRIGKKPVSLPAGVSAAVSGQSIEVKGPKGTRTFKATDDVTLSVEDNAVKITPRGLSKRSRQQWGMSRTRIANLVVDQQFDGDRMSVEGNPVGLAILKLMQDDVR